jgi:hypothetical protein
MRCWKVCVISRLDVVHHLRRQQLLGHGGHGGDELHGLPDEQCGVCGSDELLL